MSNPKPADLFNLGQFKFAEARICRSSLPQLSSNSLTSRPTRLAPFRPQSSPFLALIPRLTLLRFHFSPLCALRVVACPTGRVANSSPSSFLFIPSPPSSPLCALCVSVANPYPYNAYNIPYNAIFHLSPSRSFSSKPYYKTTGVPPPLYAKELHHVFDSCFSQFGERTRQTDN